MSGLVFLLAALALSVVGSLVLWLRQRQPTSFDRGIEDFSREMKALAPPTTLRSARRSSERRD